MPDESKLELIRKLLAQAEDKAASPEEAETFMARATALMSKYGVEEAMLAAAGKRKDEIGVSLFWIRNPYAQRKKDLLAYVALALNCHTVFTRGRAPIKVSLVGFEGDRERVEILYTSLLVQAVNALERETVPWGESPTAFRGAFLKAFATRVHWRLKEQEKAAASQHDREMADGERPAGPSTELVLADRKQQVTAYYEVFSADATTVRGYRPSSEAGRVAGRQAGDRADLGNKQVGGDRLGIRN